MKSEILCALRETDGFVSGQELCEKLQVSRTAVWKSIKQLQEDGYEIEAVSRKGYRILNCPDTIAAEELESRLSGSWIGHPVYYFPEIDSTNTYTKKIAEEGAAEGTLVVADVQTAGKGRRGRVWETPAGSTVAMTVLLRPVLSPENISRVTLVMGLAVAMACRELYHLPAGIKWPNDVVCNGKKICGILTEMSAELSSVNYVVIGTGINANIKEFPEQLQNVATSLLLETGDRVNRGELIACCMKKFQNYYEKYVQTEDLSLLMDQYNEILLNCGQEVRVLEPNREYTGKALGINKNGELQIIREDGAQVSVYAGEVSVRGIYGYV